MSCSMMRGSPSRLLHTHQLRWHSLFLSCCVLEKRNFIHSVGKGRYGLASFFLIPIWYFLVTNQPNQNVSRAIHNDETTISHHEYKFSSIIHTPNNHIQETWCNAFTITTAAKITSCYCISGCSSVVYLLVMVHT